MSVSRTRTPVLDVCTEVANEMRLPKLVVLKEIIATVTLSFLAWQGRAPSLAVAGIGVINTVSVAELYRAWKQVQVRNREETLDDEKPPRP